MACLGQRLLPASDARIFPLPDIETIGIKGRVPGVSPRRRRVSATPALLKESSKFMHGESTSAACTRIIPEVTSLLSGMLESSVSAVDFAHVAQAHTGDIQWLAALGQAILEVHTSKTAAHHKALREQKQSAADAQNTLADQQARLAQYQRDIQQLSSELASSKAENVRRQEEIDFLSMFRTSGELPRPPVPVPPASATTDSSGHRTPRHVGATRVRLESSHRRYLGELSRHLVREDPAAREDRVRRIEQTIADHDKKASAELERVKAEHKEEVKRLNAAIAEERKSLAGSIENREKDATQRREEEERQVRRARAEVEAYKLREASARAQASAASQVLVETQAALHNTRVELERTQLALTTATQSMYGGLVHAPGPGNVAPPNSPPGTVARHSRFGSCVGHATPSIGGATSGSAEQTAPAAR